MRAKHIFAVLFFLLLQPAFAAPGGLPAKEMKINESKPTYTIDVAYPRTGVANIDREIETWAQDLVREFQDSAKDQGPGPQIGPWSAEVSYHVERNDAQMFSVMFTYYSFTGGAHPNSVFEAFTFLRPEGTRVELAELFTREGIERISAIAIAQLTKDLASEGMGDTDWIKKGAAPNPRNFANFVLRPTELTIYFDAYHVAPYAAGAQEVHIPIVKLKGTLRPDPRAPAASFDCARASGDIETAICGDRALARLDRHVAEAYFDKLVWEGDEAKRFTLRKDQRAWLIERDGCRVRAESFVGCLTRVYQARLKALDGAS
jgi:uncharacterized protein YecT (DUF1311 family)